MRMYRGRVEINTDDLNLQRVRVRVLGIHSFNEIDLPSNILPYAEPILPLTSGKISDGHGEFDVPDVGDWVMVFYDEEDVFNKSPYYFGTIRGKNDTNSNYSQVKNYYSQDRYGNKKLIDKDTILEVDEFNNEKIITKDYEKYTDQFNNTIILNKKGVTIVTKNKNYIKIDEENDEITLKTKKDASIKITDKNDIKIHVGNTTLTLNDDGELDVYTKGTKNYLLDFNKFMTLFNSHTHTVGVIPSTPPVISLNTYLHSYDGVNFFGRMSSTNVLVSEDSNYEAENDSPGTIYTNKESIHPDTIIPDEYSVASTKLVNNSTNPSTDEFEGVLNTPSLPPKYTGNVITKVKYYKRGKVIGEGELVKIQGKVIDKNIAKILYKMIKESQIYNMVERLKLLKKENTIYIVTEKGSKELTKDNGEFYEEGDVFNMTEDYQNNKCTYSLVVINSGYRPHSENIIDPETNQILAISQLYLRRKNMSYRMTEHELLTKPSRDFSPYTAVPGYSKHQNGIAVDFNTRGGGQNEWLEKNASKYGFKRTVKSERWHYEYFG